MPPNIKKEAGAIVHLVEELSDARLRCDQLTAYVAEAVRLIEKSPHKDHIFEAAGHLIHAAPQTLIKVQKAIEAAAFAANRIDYEDLKTGLRPEKVQQLDQGLENIRIRQIYRRSEPTMPITPQYVAEKLRQFAAQTREGALPEAEILQFVSELEGGKKQASEPAPFAEYLDKFAESAEKGNKDYQKLATVLCRMVGDNHVKTAKEFPKLNKPAQAIAHSLDVIRDSGKELLRAMDQETEPYITAVDAGALRKLVQIVEKYRHDFFGWGGISFVKKEASEAEAWKADVARSVEAAAEPNPAIMKRVSDGVRKHVEAFDSALAKYKSNPSKMAPQLENALDALRNIQSMTRLGMRSLGAKLASDDEEKQSRFEEGKPADPTQNMSPEDKKKWQAQKEKNKDRFKAASEALAWKADSAR